MSQAVDLQAVKSAQQHMRAQGDFARVGRAQVLVSENLVRGG